MSPLLQTVQTKRYISIYKKDVPSVLYKLSKFQTKWDFHAIRNWVETSDNLE